MNAMKNFIKTKYTFLLCNFTFLRIIVTFQLILMVCSMHSYEIRPKINLARDLCVKFAKILSISAKIVVWRIYLVGLRVLGGGWFYGEFAMFEPLEGLIYLKGLIPR